MLAEYRSIDDVFHNEFLSGIMFTEAAKGKSLDISPGAHKLLKSLGTAWIEVVETPDADVTGATPLPGPYLTHGGHLLEIFRLYDDVQGAFITSLVPGQGW